MDNVPFLQLQNEGIGEVRSNVLAAVLPVVHDPFVVLVHMQTNGTGCVTEGGELEVVDAFDRCCEDTYTAKHSGNQLEWMRAGATWCCRNSPVKLL